jgi:hypothetical protein
MKKYIRLVSLILAVCMVLSVNAFADGYWSEDNADNDLNDANVVSIVDGANLVEEDSDSVTFTVTPRASSHWFSNVSIGNSKPSDMTFTCEDVVYQRLSYIVVSGTASKTSATLSAEVYRLYNGEWVRVGVYSNISGSNGQFSFSHPIGADGDYGIKIWHDLSNVNITIAGNITY